MTASLGPPFTRRDLDIALELSGVGVFAWDIRAGTVIWSETLHRLFGFEPGGFDGELQTYQACIHPEDRTRVMQVISQALESRSDYTLTHRIIRRCDEVVRHIECRGGVQCSSDGTPERMTGSVVDVTERVLAEERARQHDEITALLNELATDYVYDVDLMAPTLAPVAVAGSFARLTGYQPEEIAERGGWLQIVHPEDRETLSRELGDRLGTNPFVSEYRIITAGGQIRWLRDHVRPQTDASGKVVRLLGGVQDITENRLLEERIRAAQRVEAVAQLAGTVAHDFNNLLTIIYGAAMQLVRDEPEANAEAFAALTTATERAAELSRGLLAMGPKPARSPRPVDLHSALGEVRPLLHRAVGSASLELVPPGEPCTVLVEPGQLHLVLLNLLINAAQAPGTSQITLRMGKRQLSDRDPGRPPELAPGTYGVIEVSDNGQGIPTEILPQIFDPFVTSRPGGTGLGLSIARGIVHRHHGALTARSKVGEGATFSIFLPCSCDNAQRPEPPRGARITDGGSECVLLIEPDSVLRATLQEELGALGYRVLCASDPEQALCLPRAELDRAALVIADEHAAPRPDSPLERAFHQRPTRPQILTMTGPDSAGGSALSVSKPFTIPGLARRIRDALDAARADQG